LSSSSNSEVRKTIRRLKPLKWRTRLEERDSAHLHWADEISPSTQLLLDTTVYIDQFQGKLPEDLQLALRAASLWHSTVTESELAALVGLLDPNNPDSARAIEQVLISIERRPSHRIINPDREVWRDAGILAGLMARLQQYGKAEQRSALNDALIFLSAAKEGVTVLTRNRSDYDLLQQLSPSGKVLFYRVG
jgi:predicted nucleic acid-binding protein